MYIRFWLFFIWDMSVCFTAKDMDMLNILPNIGLSLFKDDNRFIDLSYW